MGLWKLHFSNIQTEQAYSDFRNSHKIESLEAIFVFWALILSSFIYPYLVSGNAPMIVVSIGILCAIVKDFLRKEEFIDHLKHLTVGTAFLLFLSSFIYSGLNIGENSKIARCLHCLSFAGAEIVLVNHFQRFLIKYLFLFAAFLLRCGFLIFFEHEAFIENIMMQNFVTGIFVIFTYYHSEGRERMMFLAYFDYKEEFAKFKDFLENHHPQSLIILNPQTFNPFFTNKAFAKVFTKIFSSNNFDPPETKPVNPLTVETLDLLLTQNDSVRYSCQREPDPSCLGNGATLRHFLHGLITGGFFGMRTITVTCSYQGYGGKRFLFEVVIMPLIWNKKKRYSYFVK